MHTILIHIIYRSCVYMHVHKYIYIYMLFMKPNPTVAMKFNWENRANEPIAIRWLYKCHLPDSSWL